MFSKQEAAQLKVEFWTAFGKSFPRKWILYDTKVKDFSFKFYADNKKAEVSLNIEMKDDLLRQAYFEKIQALENFLKQDYLPDAVMEAQYFLENGKVISRIWVQKVHISIFNKNSWQEIFEFFVQKMEAFEKFYQEFEAFIKDI
ncbi:DUF4268 domain-containing protein [Elizabethkingia argentiflava]|uniref:DUF4268 domain-containing protein n=1 Tax=Elizabethkingia argenteiflava TaxID=2681556 RepID=A0A845PZ96_9FLAO|nr:DUF4268 domain-containing protein [Elizabethkingia argenteiflava]NAW51767.1 DUF4268 domain-containing protein [Elizabethkingia argenteiflava]